MQIYVKKKNEKTETVAVEFLRETTIANVAATIGEPEIEYAEKSIAEKNLARGFGYEIAEVYNDYDQIIGIVRVFPETRTVRVYVTRDKPYDFEIDAEEVVR
jgi:hypothetical protein